MGKINITDADLKKSATTYRSELLIMPVIAAMATLQHMTPRPGVAGREVVGELSGDIDLGPYDPKRVDDTDLNVKPRTLETYLGSVIKEFDPNSVAKTVYGQLQAQGESLATADITRQVLDFLAMKLGGKLNKAIFTAKRNDGGTTTEDLFDGFDTITKNEITAGTIATGNGNLHEFGEAIDSTNAVDLLMDFYEKADDNLKAVPTKLFLPGAIYNAYNRDYLQTFGSVPYNSEYKKTFLEGTDNLCELVPLAGKKGTPYLHLTTQGNMVYGYGDGMADENISVEKYHPFLLSFVATMYFGCQFESISRERLFVGKLFA